jgi:hypothetical protein
MSAEVVEFESFVWTMQRGLRSLSFDRAAKGASSDAFVSTQLTQVAQVAQAVICTTILFEINVLQCLDTVLTILQCGD